MAMDISKAKVVVQRINSISAELYDKLDLLERVLVQDPVEGKIELTSTQKDKVKKIISRLVKELKDEVSKLG